MELNVTKYRDAIDSLLESREPLEFHVQARKLAPSLTLKLFHLKQETILREKQKRCYEIINAHEAQGFRIKTPYRIRRRFHEIHPPKIFNTKEK